MEEYRVINIFQNGIFETIKSLSTSEVNAGTSPTSCGKFKRRYLIGRMNAVTVEERDVRVHIIIVNNASFQ